MRPAFSSRTNRRGTTALAPALRLLFLTASDMWHLYCDLTRTRSALDHDCAANICHDIEWDDRRWNGCASSSLTHCARSVSAAHLHFVREGYLRSGLRPVHRGAFATADMRTLQAPLDSLPQRLPQRSFAGDGHAREVRSRHNLPAPNPGPQSRRRRSTFARSGARGIRTTHMPACRSSC